jgi:hypothetical protein
MSKKIFIHSFSWVSLFLLTGTIDLGYTCQSILPAGAQSEAGLEAPMFVGGRGRRGRRNYYNRMAQQQAKADALAQKKAAQTAAKATMDSNKANAKHAQAMSNYKTSDFIKEYHPNAH